MAGYRTFRTSLTGQTPFKSKSKTHKEPRHSRSEPQSKKKVSKLLTIENFKNKTVSGTNNNVLTGPGVFSAART